MAERLERCFHSVIAENLADTARQHRCLRIELRRAPERSSSLFVVETKDQCEPLRLPSFEPGNPAFVAQGISDTLPKISLKGMSHRQIAQVLQVRKSAIKSLLFRAYEDFARTVGTISMKAAN